MLEKIKPWRSDHYLAWVRDLPCAHCSAPAPSEAHHVIGISGGRMGGKSPDFMGVPLCGKCHRYLHAGRIELEAQTVWLARTLELAFHHGRLTEAA